MTNSAGPTICLVTDRRTLAPGLGDNEQLTALEHLLDEAIDAGVDMVQIRERGLETGVLVDFVSRVVERGANTQVRVLVNDRADVAVSAGAHGIHLRADSPHASRIRAVVGESALVGRSIHDGGVADSAVDFFVFGTVFSTASKPSGSPVAGLARLAGAAAASSRPLLAIGGVIPSRARQCREAGASGIAAIGVFLPPGRGPGSMGPRAAIAAFRDAWVK